MQMAEQRELVQCTQCKKRFLDDGFKTDRLGRRLKTCLECNSRSKAYREACKCSHGRRRALCKQGCGMCEHGKQKHVCPECGMCKTRQAAHSLPRVGGPQPLSSSLQKDTLSDAEVTDLLSSIFAEIKVEPRSYHSCDCFFSRCSHSSPVYYN